MLCPVCQAEISSGNAFCGKCGKQVVCDIDPKIFDIIDNRVEAYFVTKLKDQRLLEIDATEQVASRLLNWAKLFGAVAAIPLALLVATLTIWGITSFLDFHKKVDAGREQIAKEIQNNIEAVQKETKALHEQVEKAKYTLGSLPQEVEILKSRVSQIERIAFAPSSALTQSLKEKITPLLTAFQAYCRTVGFRVHPGAVQVHIYAKDLPERDKVAYYDPVKGEMNILASFAGEPSVVLREYMHRVLYHSSDVSADFGKDYVAAEAGLSCYYSSSFRNDPECGGWDLNRLSSFDTYRSSNPEVAVEWGVNVWGGLFWAMRKAFGQQTCDKVLATFWTKFTPTRSVSAKEISKALLENVNKVSPADVSRVKEMLKARSIPQP